MNNELIQKWIEALRSDKYKQGRNELRTMENRFCCLGVLCDVYDNSKWENLNVKYEYMGRIFTLPDAICNQLPAFFCKNLVIMNDIENRSFNYIADYIEEFLGQEERNGGEAT